MRDCRREKFESFRLHQYIGIWCNGNTTDFDSVVVGSSPAIPAMSFIKNIIKIMRCTRLHNIVHKDMHPDDVVCRVGLLKKER